MTAHRPRSKARTALAIERLQRRVIRGADAVAGLDCRVHSGCIDPARCRAAGRCLDLASILTPDGPQSPP